MPLGSAAKSTPPAAASAGRYRIERLLGQGGMGTVYEVTDPASGKRLALKRLGSECE